MHVVWWTGGYHASWCLKAPVTGTTPKITVPLTFYLTNVPYIFVVFMQMNFMSFFTFRASFLLSGVSHLPAPPWQLTYFCVSQRVYLRCVPGVCVDLPLLLLVMNLKRRS